MQLMVLGMHRSGTSMLARLLNMMGVYFGPEGVGTGANEENPKGFWERKDVRALNDALLLAADCDWNRVASFDPSKVPEAALEDFRKKAGKLVLDMDGHRPWFLKEPRLCLLFSIWRPLLEAPVCVHIYRDPQEVAKSLFHRNQIPLEIGTALWERYVRDALRHAHGLPTVQVGYAELMADPMVALARIYEDLVAVGVVGLRMPGVTEVQAFVDAKLYRQRSSSTTEVEATTSHGKLFNSLVSGQAFRGEPPSRLGRRVEARLANYETGLPTLPVKAQAGHRDRGDVSQEAPTVLAYASEQRPVLNQLVAERARLESELRTAREQSERAESELLSTSIQATRVASQASAYAREIDIIRNQLADERAGRMRAEAELAQAKRQAAEEAKSAEQEVDFLRRQLTDDRARLLHVESELADFKESAAQARELAEREYAELSRQREQELDEAGMKIQESEARVAALELHIANIESSHAADLERWQSEFSAKLDEARHELADETHGRKQAEASLALRFEEIGKLAKLLISRDAEIEKLRGQRTLVEWQSNRRAKHFDRELSVLRERLDGLLASRSWRLTRPVRAILRLASKTGAPEVESGTEIGADLSLLRESTMFDADWYLETYPDVRQAGMDAIAHYLEFGAAEGRDPGPNFSTLSYLMANEDVARDGINPLAHYLKYGKKEGRKLK